MENTTDPNGIIPESNRTDTKAINHLHTAEKSLKSALQEALGFQTRNGRAAESRSAILNALEATESAISFMENGPAKRSNILLGAAGAAVTGVRGLAYGQSSNFTRYPEELG